MNIKERTLTLTPEERESVGNYVELAYKGNKDALTALSGLFGEIKTVGDIWRIDRAMLKATPKNQREAQYNKIKQRMGATSIVQLEESKVINKIAAHRMAAGMTQTKLAEKLECTQKDISRWENGARNPKTDVLLKMSKLFNCTIEDLV